MVFQNSYSRHFLRSYYLIIRLLDHIQLLQRALGSREQDSQNWFRYSCYFTWPGHITASNKLDYLEKLDISQTTNSVCHADYYKTNITHLPLSNCGEHCNVLPISPFRNKGLITQLLRGGLP